MNRLAVAMILAATVTGVAAGPRIAVVRVRDIYAALPSTAELQRQTKEQRDAILRDPRADELRRIINELRMLEARLSDKGKPLAEIEAQKLARTYEITRQEAQTLQREFETFRSEREKEINRSMVEAMRASLSRIHETSRRIAAGQGCDLVLDSSGNTNTGVPFIIHQKNPTDLTEAVKAALEPAPAASAP